MASWIWTTVLVAISVYLYHELLNIKKKLSPGAKGTPLLGHVHLLGKTPHQDLHKIAKKHGVIMYIRWISIPIVIVSSLETCSRPAIMFPPIDRTMRLPYILRTARET
nr:cytochrome P450 CYP736A12-like [Ipomoea trifida]